MYQEKLSTCLDLLKELKRKRENEDLFCKVSANLNI